MTTLRPEGRFETIIRMATRLFEAPIAAVTLLDEQEHRVKAGIGMMALALPRSITFGEHVDADLLVVDDASSDPRFAALPHVAGPPHIRFYAGAPLLACDGTKLGVIAIADTVPRTGLTPVQRRTLTDLAALAVQQLEAQQDESTRASMLGFVNSTELSMISIDSQGRIDFANKAALALFGYADDGMVGETIDIIIPERFRGAHHAGLARVAGGAESKLAGKTVELMALHRNGSELPIELSLSVWRAESGVGMAAIVRDISERRLRDRRLLRLAQQDTLTGLCNRQRFQDLLGDTFTNNRPAAVLLVDLDRFKDVNDTLGHSVGDTLLQAIAVRLLAVLPSDAVVGRFDGDEFAVLVPCNGDPERARNCARAILEGFETSFLFGGHMFHLGVSIGIALPPAHGQDAEELIASADFALYSAKQDGGRVFRLFEPGMRDALTARRQTQDELLRALEAGELALYYQPQVCLADGRIFGMEALLRWHHPGRGTLHPADFMEALETSTLALPVGRWVLREACRQLAVWRTEGHTDLCMSVNLFPAQFRAGTLAQQVKAALQEYGVASGALELEITETIALHDDAHSQDIIRELTEHGVRVALDDFGTGYASLSALKRFPLTTLKIDRSFVEDLLTDPQGGTITRAMIWMGRQLGLHTVCEGIETEEQEQILRGWGCTAGQGYRYGRPMPAGETSLLLSEQGYVASSAL